MLPPSFDKTSKYRTPRLNLDFVTPGGRHQVPAYASMGTTKKTPRTALPLDLGKVLKRLH
jgi:hypothetical protein